MKRNGFTLIELVVVIVTLGILAVTAMPKFIDIERDARIEVLNTLAASIKTAADHTELKAKIHEVDENERSSKDNPPYISQDDKAFELKYGYPEAYADESSVRGQSLDIVDLIEIDDALEVCYSESCRRGNSSRVKIGYDTEEGEGCYVKYIEPGGTDYDSEEEYLVLVEDKGC